MVANALPAYPVIVVHLENPAGSGLAACSGRSFSAVPSTDWPATARWLCSGCAMAARGVAG